ncbi:Gliding motility regulatory protein [Pseudobythopirellula maris]|uniref:Gliding motility regulatory protein n=1 Tax=Pseudobythopirellula maris TaxID=2527991 RepID=A0A5C5ZUG0_9BACT|nr:response regulator [Pseudobythopirellula maris]TWT90846.1 Gliding motility regulatory protein [Pseudobythopirellula maris]
MVPTQLRRPVKNRPTQSSEVRVPHILCVDDDPDIQTTIQMRLRVYDVAVDHAYYGMQGVVEAAKSRPDMILMDIAMPNGNGEYLIDYLKSNPETRDIPVVVLTGMRDPQLKRRMLAAGAEGYLSKPVLFDDLVHEIRQHVDLRLCEEGDEI